MEKSEKINLFDSKKTKKSSSILPKTNATFSVNEKLNLFGSNLKGKKSTKQISHIDLNYVKADRVLNFYKFKNTNSKITCHGRPTIKQVKSMKQVYHVNYCLTLQKQRENPHDIEKYCLDNSISWQLIELDGANAAYLRKKDVMDGIVEGLLILCRKIIQEKLILFIHCAAGLHRTGTVLYTLLRIFDETPESAMEAIKIIRLDTYKEVGKERIRIAESMIYPELLKRIKKEGIELPIGKDFTDIKEEINKENQKFTIESIILKEDENFNTDKKITKNVKEPKIDTLFINNKTINPSDELNPKFKDEKNIKELKQKQIFDDLDN